MDVDDAPKTEEPKIEINYEAILKELRREWKWAGASDFLYKFNPMLHLDFLDLADLEHDLIHGTSDTVMTVFVKILGVLTSIRGLATDSWETYLRRLYARRVPENRVWGTEEEPIAWTDLGWRNRLDVLYDLCEWQFQNPLRVRQSMKDDHDNPSWRSKPIGRDAKRNEYWHLGRNRLWIQRPVSKPDPPKDPKPKRPPTNSHQRATKRKATEKAPVKPTAASKKAKTEKPKTKPSKTTAEKAKAVPAASASSRASRRGRSDGWQRVPDEWLKPVESAETGATRDSAIEKDVEALFDDASDLTDLSDEKKPTAKPSMRKESSLDSDSELTDLDEDESEDEEDESALDGAAMDVDTQEGEFVEFETICVTMSEWTSFAERFKTVKSQNERRLYKYITLVIIPEMEEYQKALEEKQKRELRDLLKREQAAAAAAAAEARPKRSTRLAAIVDGEDDKKRTDSSVDGDSIDIRWGLRGTRVRRAAVRGQRWMEEQEERLAALDGSEEGEEGDGSDRGEGQNKKRKTRDRSDQEDYHDEDSEEPQPPSTPNTVEMNTRGRPRRAAAVKADQMRPVIPTRKRRRHRSESEEGGLSDDPFFLNCEICKKSGWNEDDGQHLLECKDCAIYQHLACHDREDRLQGRPKRDWSQEPFVCASCTAKAQNKRPKRGRKPKELVEEHVAEAASPNARPDMEVDISSVTERLQHVPVQSSTKDFTGPPLVSLELTALQQPESRSDSITLPAEALQGGLPTTATTADRSAAQQPFPNGQVGQNGYPTPETDSSPHPHQISHAQNHGDGQAYPSPQSAMLPPDN